MKSLGTGYSRPQIILSVCSSPSLTYTRKKNKSSNLPHKSASKWTEFLASFSVLKEIRAWDILSVNLGKQTAILHYTVYCQKTNTSGSDVFKTSFVFFFSSERFWVWQKQNNNHSVQHFFIWETQFSIKSGLRFF